MSDAAISRYLGKGGFCGDWRRISESLDFREVNLSLFRNV